MGRPVNGHQEVRAGPSAAVFFPPEVLGLYGNFGFFALAVGFSIRKSYFDLVRQICWIKPNA
jgi:hypothetical protein